MCRTCAAVWKVAVPWMKYTLLGILSSGRAAGGEKTLKKKIDAQWKISRGPLRVICQSSTFLEFLRISLWDQWSIERHSSWKSRACRHRCSVGHAVTFLIPPRIIPVSQITSTFLHSHVLSGIRAVLVRGHPSSSGKKCVLCKCRTAISIFNSSFRSSVLIQLLIKPFPLPNIHHILSTKLFFRFFKFPLFFPHFPRQNSQINVEFLYLIVPHI